MTRKEELVNTITREELYKCWVIDNLTYPQMINHFGLKKRWELTYLLRYYEFPRKDSKLIGKSSSKAQKETWNNKSQEEKDIWSEKCRQVELNLSEEIKNTKSEKYKSYWYNLSDEERDVINSKRRESCQKAWEDPSVAQRQHETTNKNRLEQKGKLCRTIAEQKMYDFLITQFDDVVYDKKIDDRYPNFVDFYIPSLDLFIELNAHPAHGRLPFNKMSFEEYSKYPTS